MSEERAGWELPNGVVDRVVGPTGEMYCERLMDVWAISCCTCWALIRASDVANHAAWHINSGHATP